MSNEFLIIIGICVLFILALVAIIALHASRNSHANEIKHDLFEDTFTQVSIKKKSEEISKKINSD